MPEILAALRWFDWVGYAGMALGISAFFMRTMIPLRVFAIGATLFLGVYGVFNHSWPNVVNNFVALPIHVWRLAEMMRLVRRVKAAAESGELTLAWLKPFMSARRLGAGAMLFRKGDEADHMHYIVAGRIRLDEFGIVLGPGEVIGEVAMFSPAHKRTATATALDAVELLSISETHLKQLYYQNPQFGFYLIQLITRRLVENEARMAERLGGRVAAS
jgi:hypothetical protein